MNWATVGPVLPFVGWRKGARMGIQIAGCVGRGAANAPPDVVAIGGALVAVGVDNGGIFGVPLGLGALGDAIANFQSVQGLSSSPDGRVDPGGNSLRRINAILFPDEVASVHSPMRRDWRPRSMPPPGLRSRRRCPRTSLAQGPPLQAAVRSATSS